MKVLQQRTAVAAVMASLVFAAGAPAQMPTSPWKKGAPFPPPDEELYGVALHGKMYVIGGWDDGKAGGVNYEYNPATDKWTKKQPMPRPAHHAALAAANGKIYVMADSLSRRTSPSRVAAHGNRSTTRGSTIPRRTPGSRCRRCPASAGRRWLLKSAARYM